MFDVVDKLQSDFRSLLRGLDLISLVILYQTIMSLASDPFVERVTRVTSSCISMSRQDHTRLVLINIWGKLTETLRRFDSGKAVGSGPVEVNLRLMLILGEGEGLSMSLFHQRKIHQANGSSHVTSHTRIFAPMIRMDRREKGSGIQKD